eukprot:1158933-Pelagomonas_calceolata.AAC.5
MSSSTSASQKSQSEEPVRKAMPVSRINASKRSNANSQQTGTSQHHCQLAKSSAAQKAANTALVVLSRSCSIVHGGYCIGKKRCHTTGEVFTGTKRKKKANSMHTMDLHRNPAEAKRFSMQSPVGPWFPLHGENVAHACGIKTLCYCKHDAFTLASARVSTSCTHAATCKTGGLKKQTAPDITMACVGMRCNSVYKGRLALAHGQACIGSIGRNFLRKAQRTQHFQRQACTGTCGKNSAQGKNYFDLTRSTPLGEGPNLYHTNYLTSAPPSIHA